MRKNLVLGVLAALLALALGGRTWAQESSLVKALGHKELEKKVLIIHDNNVADLQKLTKDPTDRWKICDIQCEPEKLTADDLAVVMAWVQQGGSLWYQDSRMASSFGMQAAPLSPDEVFKSNPIQAPYNTHQKFDGLSVVAYPVGDEPVLSGVDAAVGFLIPVGNKLYSAVRGGGDVVGLLRVNPSPEADDAYKMVAAYKRVGTGTIVFKPLVWVESLASDRFQLNLREWAAGYPVPNISDIPVGGHDEHLDMHGANLDTQSPNLSTHGIDIDTPGSSDGLITAENTDSVTLNSGDVLHGTIQNTAFHCEATGGNVSKQAVNSIEMGAGEDVLNLRSGQSLHSVVDFGNSDLKIKLVDGSTRVLRKSDIRRIDLDHSSEKTHG